MVRISLRRGSLWLAGGSLVIGLLASLTGLPVGVSSRTLPSNVRQIGETRRVSPSFAVGPQVEITCPAGAIGISPGATIQTVVNAYPGNTTFCLKAGIHRIASAVSPKTGNRFVGEYGAILDGTGWTTDDPDQGAFRAHDHVVDNVTIRNLVIRNMPRKAIHASFTAATGWTIEYNELTLNGTGVAAPNQSAVRHNYVHHNTVGGYSAYRAVNTTFENNEIAYNGGEQKIVGAANVIFRNNFVHNNAADGIWYDADNTGSLIEGNQVDDNGREGISYEISGRGVIRNNTIRRSATTGIFISTSRDVEIDNNTLEDNFRGIQYFLNCDAVGGGSVGFDLANDTARDNTIIVGNTSGAYANGFAYLSSCPMASVAPYVNGSKNLIFVHTKYVVPSRSSKYWFWGLTPLKSLTDPLFWGPNSVKSWSEWQALGQDTAGVVSE
jgi:parallel beta-helix repeat protein